MANSSLLGIEPSNPAAPGHDDLALGPSDSSDSGSDLMGLDSPDAADLQLPLDRALADDAARPLGDADTLGSTTDTAGTGERRSAAGDAGAPDGTDIGVDRVFRPVPAGPDDNTGDDPSAADVEALLAQSPVEDGADDEDDDNAAGDGRAQEDEAADPVGDGHSDAALADSLPPQPGRPAPRHRPARRQRRDA